MSTIKILEELQEIKKLLALRKQIWNLEDFCSFTGISKAYAYHLTSSGKIKCYRPTGKLIFFDPEEVFEFLKQNPVADSKRIASKANVHLLTSKS